MYESQVKTIVTTILITVFSVTPGVAQKHDSQWRQLFNGHDLRNWNHVGDGSFIVENGILKSVGGMGLLWYTPEKFGRAVIRVEYKNPDGANSGIFIRIPEVPTEPWMPVNRGYEVQIDGSGDDHHITGALYSFTKAAARPEVADEWNTLEISLFDDRTVVRVNGVSVTDFVEGQEVPPKKEWYEPDRGTRSNTGYIGIQNHFPEDTVYFREISVRPLSEDD